MGTQTCPGRLCQHALRADALTLSWLAQVLQFVHGITAQLAEAGAAAEMALQLFLAAAQAASDEAHLDVIAYEFFEQVGADCIGSCAVFQACRLLV